MERLDSIIAKMNLKFRLLQRLDNGTALCGMTIPYQDTTAARK